MDVRASGPLLAPIVCVHRNLPTSTRPCSSIGSRPPLPPIFLLVGSLCSFPELLCETRPYIGHWRATIKLKTCLLGPTRSRLLRCNLFVPGTFLEWLLVDRVERWQVLYIQYALAYTPAMSITPRSTRRSPPAFNGSLASHKDQPKIPKKVLAHTRWFYLSGSPFLLLSGPDARPLQLRCVMGMMMMGSTSNLCFDNEFLHLGMG